MATPEDRLAAYFDIPHPSEPFKDEQIEAIALLLSRCSHTTEKLAARSPRTYIIFRRIGRCDLVPRLLSEGFGDDWFPVTSRGLPGYLEPHVRTDVVQIQHLILTKSLDLENGRHCNYDSEVQRPFVIQSYIGSGSFGQVRVIESRVTYKQYALKTIRRNIAFGTKSKEIMDVFKAELRIMKRLQHRHIVRYIGSYTDRNDLGLLMTPIADCDLAAYLENACRTPGCHPTLRTFFGCLATALSYLHDKGIKHRDIKPKNVLIYKANVLLADFGISRDFMDTTTGPTTATQRYCSPEVANYEGRNASADVWSLGCVFLEMQSALQSRNLPWIKSYYETHGSGSTHYHANPQATLQLLDELREAAVEPVHTRPLVWIEHMLAMERKARRTAAEVMNKITSSDSIASFMYSCDQCCYPSSETESVRRMADEPTKPHRPEPATNNEQIPDAASLATKSLGANLPRLGPKTQTPMIADRIMAPGRRLSFVPELAAPMLPRLGLDEVDASTDKETSRDLVIIKNENGHHKERSSYPEESRDEAVTSMDRNLAPGSQPTNWPVDLKFREAAESFQDKLAALSTGKSPQDIGASCGEENGPGPNDIYKGQDGFTKVPHAFRVSHQVKTWKGWVPNLVVHCTRGILEPSQDGVNTRLLDRNVPYLLTQERFTLLRGTFRTNSTADVEKEEMPLLLCRYLECLAVPIIPEDNLRKWPVGESPIYAVRTIFDTVKVLEHCVAIMELGRCRRDLLIYFLLYMAMYASESGYMRPAIVEDLARLYGPYLCGRNYQQQREKEILVYLIKKVNPIVDELKEANKKKGSLRENLTSKLELEKTKRNEEHAARKVQLATPKRSLFERAAFRVLDMVLD